ncbi:MAG: hypothetical protein AABW67_02370 [Nanoarchaeota archaeon]
MNKKQNIKNKENLPECCKPKSRGIKAGLISGIIPHSGCIAIILFALLGVTAANTFFIKFLSYKYYIPSLFVASFFIASVAAFFYTRRFPDRRIKSHWKYLAVLYSSIIIINLLMIYMIFPYATNLSSSGNVISNLENTKTLKLSFEIPCPGHASLVVSELEKTSGIEKVKYLSGANFEVLYNPKEINKEQILEQDICKEFDAKER